MNKVVYNATYGGFSLTKEAMLWMMDHGYKFKDYDREYVEKSNSNSFHPEVPRHHPLLVECVETFAHASNGALSSLRIKEIYSDLYKIIDRGGLEIVETPERMDWIVIK